MVEDGVPERPVVSVVGERVAFGPLRRDLLPAFQRWTNDLAVADRFGVIPRPTTPEHVTAWYEREAATTDRLAFTVDTRCRPGGRSGRET